MSRTRLREISGKPLKQASETFKGSCKYLVVLLFFFTYDAVAQEVTGTLYGQVSDAVTFMPLENAEVTLTGSQPLQGTITDESGYFHLENIPVGRYIFQISHIGYTTHSEEVLVRAGKSRSVYIHLQPSSAELNAVVVSGNSFSIGDQLNKREVTIEQATRFAANYLDPARVMTSFPGVVVQNDQNNNLIVNGKPPTGILWQLEGFDIVNPNHLSNAGTLSDLPTQAGGGVNILSAQVLDNTSFIGLPFQATYGNALSGIMDMSFRDGNKRVNEYTAQASLIGLDFSAEGPISEGKSSFLANYRYSTVGLLTQLGVDFGGENITYQDFSFKLAFDHKKGGKLEVFGFGGISNNNFDGVTDPVDWEIDKDSTMVDYSSDKAALGIRDSRNITPKISVIYGTTMSYAQNQRSSSGLTRQQQIVPARAYDSRDILVSSIVELDFDLSGSGVLQLGLKSNYYSEELLLSDLTNSDADDIDGSLTAFMHQPYLQYSFKAGSRWKFSSGLRYMYLNSNNTSELYFNTNIDYFLVPSTTLQLSASRQGQRQLTSLYLSNPDLDFTNINYAGLGLSHELSGKLLHVEAFYELMTDIPVSAVNPAYSVINEINDFSLQQLDNGGEATFYGVNLSLEKPLENNFYYLVSGSLYDAEYKGSDDVQREMRFNGNYSLSVTGGKEWRKDRNRNKIGFFSIDSRVLYAGGIREALIDVDQSRVSGQTAFNITQGYPVELDDYIRLDLRLSWRKEKKRYTRTFSIDIQNVFNIENDAFQYFDFRKDDVVTQKQLGIIPVLIYRIDF